MHEQSLTQKVRFLVLIAEVILLCLGSYLAFGSFFPPSSGKGFWFYSALLGLVLGSRLDTPFFAKPADVILYAAPAAIALLLGSSWQTWDSGEKVAFVLAVAFCVFAGLLGACAILIQDTENFKLQKLSNAARVLAETLGNPRIIFTVVVAFALYAFHRNSAKELGIIGAVWALTALLSPLEGSVRLFSRLRRIWQPDVILDADGEVVAYQTPGVILIRQTLKSKIALGSFVAVQDPLGKTRLALAVDHVGRDEGILLRAIELSDVETPRSVQEQTSSLRANSVAAISVDGSELPEARLVQSKNSLVGLVAPETSVETVLFEVVNTGGGLEEGRLVEVQVGKRTVTYQVVNGLTKEEIVHQKNTFGYSRVQAQKIGEWDAQSKRFRLVKWLPDPNSPVFLKTVGAFEPLADAIGHLPGTDYGVTLRRQDGEEVGLESMVTHNTAILGILGIGKSTLALEIVERMITRGIKVICLDLTNQYASALAPYYNSETETACIKKLQATGQSGKKNVKKNVEEGGSRQVFEAAIAEDLKHFVNPENVYRLKIYNPAQFEVWKQDSKPYQDTASMASLTPAEITHIISDATLKAVAELGMTDRARVCLVYEEAHSLVPEWNSSVAEGDRGAANGSARSILQGRKYGLGCLLITQRTANVTKTILNQCNTVFAMRTFDETGKEFLGNYLGREYANMLPTLEERQAVFFGRGSSCENPILIRLNDRGDFTRVFRQAHPPPSVAVASETTERVQVATR
jgi:hypothetical protein